MAECMHPECDRKAVAKGCCEMHYRRILKFGSMMNRGSVNKDTGNDKERFFKKIRKDEKTGCWMWTGGHRKNSKGTKYGRHNIASGSIGAHRFSYLLHNNVTLKSSEYICHKCDTPLCVNPDHLFLGSHKDNMKDMVNKKRSCILSGGEKGRSVLTNAQAIAIFLNSTDTYISLAKKYNVSEATIGRVKRRESYPDALNSI